LRNADFEVTSTWLKETNPLDSQMGDDTEEFYIETSTTDLDDVARAHIMIFFAETPETGTTRGGRHVEFGYALACGKPIYVIGGKENVFHYQPKVFHFDNFHQALVAIDEGYYI
jgi:hypothetical protein